MSKRTVLLTIVSGLIIVAIAVGVGLYTYTNIQNGNSYKNAEKEMNRYMTMNDWYTFEIHNMEQSVLSFYTNEDRSVIGLAEIDVETENLGSVTKQTEPNQSFDFVTLQVENKEYIGVHLKERPEDVVYLRLKRGDESKEFTVNNPEDETYVMTYVMKLNTSSFEEGTLETLDRDHKVLSSQPYSSM
ncbi:hypothetical protein ACFQO8_00930 [Exiguobacterium aestuarii]|uniref:DUF4825 domain-containing protein n=1 Tax=Exiguobacterium aestuarii TaxID=273527 RepID=A0ABW2PHB0_9BACL|nr:MULTISPECIES: hypothetical protein [Exiguobacterium]MCT4784852.1 hypothetical protein [Exiguobacterium aestuarii]